MASILDVLFKADYSDLDKASEAAEKLHKHANHASEAGEHLETIFKGMGSAVGEAVEHISRFNNTIGKMMESLEHLATTNVKTIGGLGAFGSEVLAATATAAAFVVVLGLVGVALAFEAAEHIEKMTNLAIAYGYSATQALLMSKAAEKAGSSLDAIEATYVKVAKAAYNANDPLKGTGAAFRSLGIDIKESNGELKSAQELTNEAIEKWKEGKQTTEEFAATTAVLGKGWEKNLPALEAVAEANKVANELQQKGIGISKESSAIVEENTKAHGRMGAIMADVGSRLVEIVIPAFTNLVKWFNTSYESGGLVRGIFVAINASAEILMFGVKLLSSAFQYLEFLLVSVGKGIAAVAASLAMLASGDMKGAKNVWTQYFEDVKKGAESYHESLKDLWKDQGEHTVEPNKEGNSGKGGGDTKDKPVVVKSAIGEAKDMYAAYQVTLDKTLETVEHFNQVQKASAEIARLDAAFEKEKQKITEENNRILKEGGTLKATYSSEELKRITAEKEAIMLRAKAVDDEHAKQLIEVEDYKKLNDFVTKYNNTIDDEIRHRHMSAEQIREENAQRTIEAQLEGNILKLKHDNIWTMERENELRAQAAKATDDVHAATLRLDEANTHYIKNGVADFMTSMGTMDKAAENLTAKGLNGMTDAITNLVVTGKNGFKQLVASMLEEIAKLILKYMVLIPLMKSMQSMMGGFGGIGAGAADAGGSAASAASVVGSAADGGEIGDNNNNGRSILVGEHGPEMFIPRGAGTIVPNNKINVGSGSSSFASHITNNITVQGSSNSSAADNLEQARLISTMIEAKTKQTLAQQLLPGGMLSAAQRRF
ncbi:phage tail tape measure C-terminal domain-containing protein [Sapientia aquatica]|uniref:Bacteriophage tail tape measure C-terminal domain-containing protein n=1 Tax=Sapientia aquatica TaxID=1549640 RepID=A0A4R5VWC6_9BURK|nr:phage tail tape measure C-terminal domain-containing protein [Sapientia aquatica]TDK63554.1 hypothetical protein E2I14_15245 [Sapientia aquatica]